MKKILAILGAISFSAIGASNAIACNSIISFL
ncbi:lipoprotein [Spiroplasma kunkelii]|nr:lipoprotein [Spiroplasma kunkelii]